MSKNKKPTKVSKADLELKKENKAIASLGPKWKERKGPLYIAMERLNINYSWEENEVFGVKAQVEDGRDLAYMVNSFKRPANDLRALIFELALLEEISKLPKGF
jgi:hypothetical protein